MSRTMQAHDNWYKGNHLKSMLERRWLVLFDEMGIRWKYEPETFTLYDGEQYTPDVYLPDCDVYCEIKPYEAADELDRVAVKFVTGTLRVLMLLPEIPKPDERCFFFYPTLFYETLSQKTFSVNRAIFVDEFGRGRVHRSFAPSPCDRYVGTDHIATEFDSVYVEENPNERTLQWQLERGLTPVAEREETCEGEKCEFFDVCNHMPGPVDIGNDFKIRCMADGEKQKAAYEKAYSIAFEPWMQDPCDKRNA